jgi:hypothetical protein
MSGIQRTVTVTRRGRLGWTHGSDLGWRRRPKLHGMQGVGRPYGSVCHFADPSTATIASAALNEATQEAVFIAIAKPWS